MHTRVLALRWAALGCGVGRLVAFAVLMTDTLYAMDQANSCDSPSGRGAVGGAIASTIIAGLVVAFLGLTAQGASGGRLRWEWMAFAGAVVALALALLVWSTWGQNPPVQVLSCD